MWCFLIPAFDETPGILHYGALSNRKFHQLPDHTFPEATSKMRCAVPWNCDNQTWPGYKLLRHPYASLFIVH